MKKYLRSLQMLISRKGCLKRVDSTSKAITTPKSGMTKEEALKEIDKLQKGILTKQTKKVFVKSVYENEYKKYWDIENQITDTQKKVCSLQDEFGIEKVIEDNEAQTLMATTAIKSCQETFSNCKRSINTQSKMLEQGIIESKIFQQNMRHLNLNLFQTKKR